MIASVKPPLALKKRQLSEKQLQKHNSLLGQRGEHYARQYLLNKQYTFLDQNVRLGNSEVDLVFLDRRFGEIVFVEVKTRSSNVFGSGSNAVGYQKLQSLNRVARAYLQKHRLKNGYRFDIICVVGNHIEHFENVSWNF